MKIAKSILLSWDFGIAVAIALATAFLLPNPVKNEFVRDVYNVGISVLSIVFSVYFAALAIIISSSDDDFVRFLEQGGHYTIIVQAFEWTLLCLFVSLIYSIVAYILTSAWITDNPTYQTKWLFVGFCFLFSYSLFAAFFATRDSLIYSRFRAKFVNCDKKD